MEPYKTNTPPSYPSKEMKELFKAFLSLKNQKEAANFFRDLLTMAEIGEFSNRWQMVQLLMEGKPYLEISQKLKTSTTTVARVAHWLNNGLGGYETIASRVWGKKHQKPHNYFPA